MSHSFGNPLLKIREIKAETLSSSGRERHDAYKYFSDTKKSDPKVKTVNNINFNQ